jgi:hypothetical protein
MSRNSSRKAFPRSQGKHFILQQLRQIKTLNFYRKEQINVSR